MFRFITAMLLVVAVSTATTVQAHGELYGFAAHYRVGLMERVSRVRGMPIVRCMVASSYYPLGTWLVVTSKRTGNTSLCRVTDITQKRHIRLVRSRGIVIEFGAANIWEMCGLRRVAEMPPRDCGVVVSVARKR